MHGSCVCVVEIQERAGPVLLNCIEYDLTFDCSDKVLCRILLLTHVRVRDKVLTRHPLLRLGTLGLVHAWVGQTVTVFAYRTVPRALGLPTL